VVTLITRYAALSGQTRLPEEAGHEPTGQDGHDRQTAGDGRG